MCKRGLKPSRTCPKTCPLHATEFRLPFVVGGTAHAGFLANVLDGSAAIYGLHDLDDLILTESLFAYVKFLAQFGPEVSTLQCTYYKGGLQGMSLILFLHKSVDRSKLCFALNK